MKSFPILGATGRLDAIAAVRKAFFGHHKGKTVKFGKDGDVVQADGLSIDSLSAASGQLRALDLDRVGNLVSLSLEHLPDGRPGLSYSPGCLALCLS